MDTTNDYNDEPDYDQMIAEDQRGCAGPGPPSDDDTEDHMREEYNAGDRAAKRPRLGPESTDEAITNHANGNRANAGEIPARQWEYISVDGGILKQMYTDILPSTEGHRTNGPQGKVHANDVPERNEPPVAPGETNGTVATAGDDGNAGETISNHSNSNRTNLPRNQQPTRMNTTIIDGRYASSADHIEVARLRGRNDRPRAKAVVELQGFRSRRSWGAATKKESVFGVLVSHRARNRAALCCCTPAKGIS